MAASTEASTKPEQKELPEFGHGMLSQFCFRPGLSNLNHGSHGSLPSPVLAAVNDLSLLSEAQPDKFLRFTSRKLLDEVRERLAPLVKADVDEIVLVPNATHGVSTVFLNLDWKEGDVIVVFSFTYAPILRAVQALADLHNLTIHSIPTSFPTSHSTFLAQFRTHLSSLPSREGQKVVVLIDAIASLPGVVLPWEEMIRICRERGAVSVVDGAHQLGMVRLDLHGVDPDFWTSNAHKWLLSKRASGVLYVPKRNQHMIKFSLPISSGYVSPKDAQFEALGTKRFTKLFEYTGTIDYVPLLSIGPALDFRLTLGGEERINAYCHELALRGGERVAEILGTELLDKTGEWTANMTNILLPLQLPLDLPTQEARTLIYGMTDRLADERDVMVNIFPMEGRWWVRLCAQVWLEMSDFEKAAYALKDLCEELNQREERSS